MRNTNHPGRPHPQLDAYLRDIRRTPLLSAGQEREVAYRVANGDPEARDHLARANLRLVVKIARGYARKGMPLQDLIEEGNLGLLRAVEGYDPDMNTRFSTYASYWIKQSIRRALTRTSHTIRLPAHLQHLLSRWRRADAELREELGRAPADGEVARRLGLAGKKLRTVLHALRNQQAAPNGADEERASVDLFLPDHRCKAPEVEVADEEEKRKALGLLDGLDRRKALVLRLRFGLEGDEALTLEEIGGRLGLTRERVRQIERQALADLAEKIRTPGRG
jgi:RNA polymerase primary sigma factor